MYFDKQLLILLPAKLAGEPHPHAASVDPANPSQEASRLPIANGPSLPLAADKQIRNRKFNWRQQHRGERACSCTTVLLEKHDRFLKAWPAIVAAGTMYASLLP
jgi:hypothetical protein